MSERTKSIACRMLPKEIILFHSLCRAEGTSASKQLRELARRWMTYKLDNGVEFESVSGDLRKQRVEGIELIK